jgi:hypothetical protein
VDRFLAEEKPEVQAVLSALNTLRVGIVGQEYDLQAEIARVLTSRNIPFRKEYPLAPRHRIARAARRSCARSNATAPLTRCRP